MSKLILMRHGESEWNAQGLWTGITEVGLTENGIEQARRAGELLRDVEIHSCHCSMLTRTHHTWELFRDAHGCHQVEPKKHHALNERDYGTLTGKNKWQVRDEVGEEVFHQVRRSWDYPVPGGESLKDVYQRVVPYYAQNILPELLQNQNVLVSAHGNTLRALMKHIERISDDGVASLEVGFAEIHLYTVDADGFMIEKEVR